MSWKVFIDDVQVKSYSFKLQAITYCLMNGYIYSGWDDWEFGSRGSICVLDKRVKIIRSKDD